MMGSLLLFLNWKLRKLSLVVILMMPLGQMSYLFLFYQKFWDIIKGDLFRLVEVFQEGKLDLFRLNFATLNLIPKVEDASKMKNFGPINLLNCSFKIFGRLLTSKLEKICERIVVQEQSAFIRGIYILESVVVAQEVVHSLHRSKEPGVVIKLDYEKVYNRVNLDFLFQNLRSRGFSEKWVEWIKMLVWGGGVCQCYGNW
jgi:hypothetical protein